MVSILAAGDWSPEQIDVRWGAESRLRLPEIESAIEEAWTKTLAKRGVNLFDGPMCRLESWEASPDALRLVLSRTTFKAFVGTNLSNASLADAHGANALANPLGLSVLLETTDGFLMLGRRNARVAHYPNRIHPFAGTLEPGDEGNLYSGARRELVEEISLAPGDTEILRCRGIVEDRSIRQPEAVFWCLARRARRDIEKSVDAREHRSSYAIPVTRCEVERAIQSPELTPVAVGSLLIWGRSKFGGEWMKQFADISKWQDDHGGTEARRAT